MTPPIVRVQRLSHRYTKDWAIRELDFDVRRTGIMGLLGSNGAGKSTFMNIMCGALYPTAGDVLINGVSIRQTPLEAKTQIGFLPQQAPLHLELTVDEYLRHCAFLRTLERNRIASAIDEAKTKCGIQHFSRRLIGNLSGGYRQRVGIAQAILHEPSVVVLDEPTNGLDPNQVLAVRTLIKEIALERTVILSTHILSEVEVLCDQIRMIEGGRIVFSGSMEEFGNVVKPHSLIAVFEAPPDEEALMLVPAVNGVERINRRKFRVTFDGHGEVSDELVTASVQHGWRLHELYFERSTLEDVFARFSLHQTTATARAA